MIRTRDEHGTVQHDDYLSNAPHDTLLADFARIGAA